MMTGVHALLNTKDAEALRAFFRDVLELRSVDANGAWLIFALPPTELGVHPTDAGSAELMLTCADLDATVMSMEAKGVQFVGEVSQQPWGKAATFRLPGGEAMTVYQPRHPVATGRTGK